MESNIAHKVFNLTLSQMMMWTGQRLNPNLPLYNETLLWDIRGAIEVLSFQKAFQKLVDLTQSLRLTFHEIDGVPMQRAEPDMKYKVEILDWSGRGVSEEDILNWASQQTKKPFDLSKRLFESILIKIAEKRYLWYFNEHHLITDARTQEMLYRRLVDLYVSIKNDNFSEQQAFPEYLSLLEIGQIEFVNENLQKYWKGKLNGLSKISTIYGSKTKTSITKSKRVSLKLDKKLTDKIRALASETEAKTFSADLSLLNVLASLLFAFLHRVCGDQTITIGSPVHNRPNKIFKETAGLFIEIYPLTASVISDKKFSDLLSELRKETLALLKNAAPGISQPGWSKVYNVVINYINTSYGNFDGYESHTTWIQSPNIDANHILRFQILDYDETGNLQLHFDVNQGVLSEKQTELIPEHFLMLIKSFLEDPYQPIGQPPLSPQKELKDPVTTIIGKSVIDLFNKQVDQRPSGRALLIKDQEITYAELNLKSNQLAGYLSNLGIKKGDRIGVCLKRSPELLMSILAILKSGGVYVPIASDYPMARIKYITQDAQVSILINDGEVTNEDYSDIKLIHFSSELDQMDGYSNQFDAIKTEPEDLVYIMYTSGSTGAPKGVMICHESLVNYLMWARGEYSIDEGSVFPLFTSIAFDLTITSLFLPLISGSTIVIYPEQDSGTDLSILDVISQNQVNIIKLTPSYLAILLNENLESSKIKSLIVGGEDFKSSHIKSIHTAFTHQVDIFNEYGPTEATVGCVCLHVDDADTYMESIPIGKPIQNTVAIVLDEFLNQAPANVVGQLYISGLGLAKGYWNNPKLTNKKFVPNPFMQDHLMYKTGDMAKVNENGVLECLGRTDDQVKVGGIRIELGEIESALNANPKIENALVRLHRKVPVTTKDEIQYCNKCGLPSNYPNAKFDQNGICHLCVSYENYRQQTRGYFKSMLDLKKLLAPKTSTSNTSYDCIVLFSGGKDSTYALAQIAEMGIQILAFTLDNGYISDQAKANIRRVVEQLGIDHIFGETPAMNAIFRDSLQRHCNVCNGCFKTLYTLSTKLALEKNIPFIVTGLSRGQFFETRLTEELFTKTMDVASIDDTILSLRKAYHRTDDAVSRLMDVSMFEDDEVFDKVRFVDFYRYCDASLEDILSFLDEQLPWIRPSDTGRSTNCLINDVGIYYHKKKKGYHNYAFPYSWDVRTGHKSRDETLNPHYS